MFYFMIPGTCSEADTLPKVLVLYLSIVSTGSLIPQAYLKHGFVLAQRPDHCDSAQTTLPDEPDALVFVGKKTEV